MSDLGFFRHYACPRSRRKRSIRFLKRHLLFLMPSSAPLKRLKKHPIHWLPHRLRSRHSVKQSDFIQSPLKVSTPFEHCNAGPNLFRNTAWRSCKRLKLNNCLLSLRYFWRTTFMPLFNETGTLVFRIPAGLVTVLCRYVILLGGFSLESERANVVEI